MQSKRLASRTIVAVASGLLMAGAAMADGERLFFEVSNDIGPSQPSAVVTLWAAFDPRDYAVAWMAADLEASEGTWSGIAIVPPMDGPGTTPGIVDGRRVEGVLAGQWNIPVGAGVFADPSNPIALWRGTIAVDDFSPRTIDLASMATRFDVYISRHSTAYRSRIDALEQAAGGIRVVPAPASGAILVLGVLAARRRRG